MCASVATPATLEKRLWSDWLFVLRTLPPTPETLRLEKWQPAKFESESVHFCTDCQTRAPLKYIMAVT